MLSNNDYVEQRPLLPTWLEERLSRGMGRISGWALLFVICACWASLLSSNIGHGAAANWTGSSGNLLGPAGAAVADLLLQTLGWASAVVLLAPMFWGLELILNGRVEALRVKAAFFPLSVLLLAGAVSSLPAYKGWALSSGFGGIAGDLIYSFVVTLGGFVSETLAPVLAGLFLCVAGFAAVVHSIGATLSDITQSVKTKELPDIADVRETADALQNGLRAAAHGMRDRVHHYSASRRTVRETDDDGRSEPKFSLSDRVLAYAQPAGVPEPELERTQPVSPVVVDEHEDDDGFDSEIGTEDVSVDASRIARKFAPQIPNDIDFDGGIAVASEPALDVPPRPAQKPAKRRIVPAGVQKTAYARFPLRLLKDQVAEKVPLDVMRSALQESAELLEETLGDFGITGEIRDVKPGPVVTMFELEPSRGTKSSRVIGLSDDIARSMSAMSVRVAVVPGRNAIGIELPNARKEKVMLRELLEAEAFVDAVGSLPMALGKSISGEPVIADLAQMPHLLVAGTTGSGKSVGLNAMILSLLYMNDPDDCRFIMIDPKMLELSVYDGIPHLLCPVVTEPDKAVSALNWVVSEMEERYRRMAKLSVRRLDVYNKRVRRALERGEPIVRTVQTGFDRTTGKAIYEDQQLDLEPMPNIVVVIDEFADLMTTAGKDVEVAVQRIAQKARAAGIHLIMATQRPSVDVITGTIKANFPTRISFKVASKVDSRTILGEQGAEQLLGHGDMLYAANGGQTVRVHGAYVSDDEIEDIAQHLRDQGEPTYIFDITEHKVGGDEESGGSSSGAEAGADLYDEAVDLIRRDNKVSISYIQRQLSIGYNRAANLVERMEDEGIVSSPDGKGRRHVLPFGDAQ